ncbi:HGGxSTG domain-containing protein [Parafrankia sp. BMG5.11]|uniref:HGGxSTG domain-containing protein n=1 Tax=Parafrankia sp. BMG5.11 TaxID=222540 RepID=UPI0035A19265
MKTSASNPMNKAHSSPRCLARTRRGTLCQCPALRGRTRCKLHGGKTQGGGAPVGNKNRLVHGRHSRAHREAMALIRQFQRAARDCLDPG